MWNGSHGTVLALPLGPLTGSTMILGFRTEFVVHFVSMCGVCQTLSVCVCCVECSPLQRRALWASYTCMADVLHVPAAEAAA